MKCRYIGADDGQIVPLSTGTVKVKRREWFEVEPDDARQLVQRDDFELESTVKAKRTRAKKTGASKPQPQPATAPAASEEGVGE